MQELRERHIWTSSGPLPVLSLPRLGLVVGVPVHRMSSADGRHATDPRAGGASASDIAAGGSLPD